MTDVLNLLRARAEGCFASEPVAFAYLFGSQAAGTTTPRSDIDVAVHLIDGAEVDTLELRLRLAGEIEHATGVGPVEVVVLDEAPLTLAGRVRDRGVVIYSRDDVARVRWDSLTARRYHDFRFHEDRVARERLAQMAKGS